MSSVVRLTFRLALAALSVLSVSATAFGQPVQARPADAFVESVGVNVHLHYYDTAYADFEGKVLPSLRDLGVRHIRDGVCPVADTTKPGRLQTLFTELGVRATLIVDPRCESVPEASEYVRETLGTGLLDALEGPNEYDLSGDPAWADTLRTYQAELYTTFEGHPATAALPLIGPSVTSEAAAYELGDVTGSADVVNLHSYYSSRHPETGGWGDNGYGSLTWQFEAITRPLGAANAAAPPVVTETGYHNAQSAEAGLPEGVTAAYLPRLLLNHFSGGIERTFVYELLDEWDDPGNREANFGLVRFDGSRKPAFVALQNLLTLLEDPGKSFAPGTLELAVTGPDDLHWTLLQKRSGTFYLALWRGAALYDPDTRTPVDVPAVSVSLRLGGTPNALRRAQPHKSATWTALAFSGPVVTLEVGPEVTLLEVVPGG